VGDRPSQTVQKTITGFGIIRAGAKAGPVDYLHPETRKVAVGYLHVNPVQNPSQDPGADPGEAYARYRIPINMKIQACNFRKTWFRGTTPCPWERVCIYFGFHVGFRRSETQPQVATRIILKIKIRDLVGFGAVVSFA
jgi:hypothetical protein